MLTNLDNKVAGGRRVNLLGSIIGTVPTEAITPDFEDDFDVHGYNPTAEEQMELFAASGRVVQISGGWTHTIALMEDGTVWAWGANYQEQLGDGTTISRSLPVQVIGLTNIVDVSASNSYSLAVDSSGEVWLWGYEDYGLYNTPWGTGYRGGVVPVQTSYRAYSDKITKISATGNEAMALSENGRVYVW
jgi:alpha-tubulin suppressor-like RCC1 family protein